MNSSYRPMPGHRGEMRFLVGASALVIGAALSLGALGLVAAWEEWGAVGIGAAVALVSGAALATREK